MIKIADIKEQILSYLLNTDILEKTFESGSVCRIWNNFFQWHFQHIESKTSSFLRHNKVVLAFGLSQLIDRKRWFKNFKNWHRKINDKKTNSRGVVSDKNNQNKSNRVNLTCLSSITLSFENNKNDSLTTLLSVLVSQPRTERTWHLNRKSMTPHHQVKN